nr:hypothetical protein [uncultured Roseateles sp.]
MFTLARLESVRAARVQLIDLGDEKTAKTLNWVILAIGCVQAGIVSPDHFADASNMVADLLDHINALSEQLGDAAPDQRELMSKVNAWLEQRELGRARPIDPEDLRAALDRVDSLGQVIRSDLAASQPAPVALKDHEVREVISAVTQVAQQYGETQQLRERIKDVLFPVLKRVPAPVEPDAACAACGVTASIPKLDCPNCGQRLQAQAVAVPEALYRVAINCPHEIDRDKVVLHFDPKQPGHNALNQLGKRLEAASALSTPVPDGYKLVPAHDPLFSTRRDAERYRELIDLPWALAVDAKDAVWTIRIPNVAPPGSNTPHQFIDAAIATNGQKGGAR